MARIDPPHRHFNKFKQAFTAVQTGGTSCSKSRQFRKLPLLVVLYLALDVAGELFDTVLAEVPVSGLSALKAEAEFQRLMFSNLFYSLKEAKVPVSLREYLTLLEGMQKGVAMWDVEEFYFLARTALVKDERNIDKFDRVFAEVFKGLETVSGTPEVAEQAIPEEWLRRMAEKTSH